MRAWLMDSYEGVERLRFGEVVDPQPGREQVTVEEQTPQLLEPARMLSSCPPFPWSRPVYEARKCVLNLVPCDNDFEREFAKFLDNAPDVTVFSKLPQAFGFCTPTICCLR